MGFFSSDKKTTTNTTNHVQNTSIGIEGVEGTSILGDGNTVVVTDHGAVSGSFNLASDAVSDVLSLGERSISGVLEYADRSGDRVLDAAADSLNFADRQNSRLGDLFSQAGDWLAGSQSDALNFADRQNTRVSDLFTGATDMLASAYESAFDTASDVLKEGQAQVATTVTNLNAIARQSSTSDAERNQAIVKYALIAAAVMAVAFAFAGKK